MPRHPSPRCRARCRRKPQMLFGVPRTFEKIHSTVQAVLAADPGRAEVFAQALDVGAQVAEHRARGEQPSAELAAEYERVDAESLRPARQLLGLDDAAQSRSPRAAPIPVEVLQFFRSAGVRSRSCYGLSESTGPMTWDPTRVKPGTVGRAIPGMELRLADDGEVLAPGRQHLPRATSTIPSGRPRRSTPTAGCTPATSASSTTRATCGSSTARRSSSSPRAARTSRPPTSKPRSRRSR